MRSLLLIWMLAACSNPEPEVVVPDPFEIPARPELSVATAERFAALALDCVHREYPNKIAHLLQADVDVAPPRVLHPAFYGCFDWHSAVHGHWLLARFLRSFPASRLAGDARAALERSLTADNLAAEVAYLERQSGFERPYGLAWLLQLAAELHDWEDPDARRWREALRPLEAACADALRAWVPKLGYPIRSGEHSQTAFAFGLALDWARAVGDADLEQILVTRSRELYAHDVYSFSLEPSGHDFLSPALAAADLQRRVLDPPSFAAWLTRALPELDGSHAAWLAPAAVTDRSDGKLVHLDGVNLSRAWMLDGIASALSEADARRAVVEVAAARHAAIGLQGVTGEHYEGGHWLASFAMYLTTRRGLPPG